MDNVQEENNNEEPRELDQVDHLNKQLLLHFKAHIENKDMEIPDNPDISDGEGWSDEDC